MHWRWGRTPGFCGWGGGGAITQADALDVVAGEGISIVADLARAWNVPSSVYDVFLVPFTFHVIDDDYAALYHSIRLLKPGGSLICNFPSISGYTPEGFVCGNNRCSVHRWYTSAGVRAMLEKLGLSEADYRISVYGNFYSLFLYLRNVDALACPKFLLDRQDASRPLLICVRVNKPDPWVPRCMPVRGEN
jgi:hypothetical protein